MSFIAKVACFLCILKTHAVLKFKKHTNRLWWHNNNFLGEIDVKGKYSDEYNIMPLLIYSITKNKVLFLQKVTLERMDNSTADHKSLNVMKKTNICQNNEWVMYITWKIIFTPFSWPFCTNMFYNQNIC